jgi:hypothetical protein
MEQPEPYRCKHNCERDALIDRAEDAEAKVTQQELAIGVTCAILCQAEAELRTLRAERDAAHAAGLAEGVAMGIEAAAKAVEGANADDLACGVDCISDNPLDAIRAIDPAAIIAARESG